MFKYFYKNLSFRTKKNIKKFSFWHWHLLYKSFLRFLGLAKFRLKLRYNLNHIFVINFCKNFPKTQKAETEKFLNAEKPFSPFFQEKKARNCKK